MADRIPRPASRRTLERRPSAASSLRSQPVDIFSDDNLYDADDLMVADGFRPADSSSHRAPSSTSSTRTTTPNPPRPQELSRSSSRRQQAPPRPSEESKPSVRSSIAKNGLAMAGPPRNEFALRHDATEVPQRMASTRTEMSQRPNSMISMFSLPPSQSPYLGASGPSHPYGMYPQDTSLNRSSTSTSEVAMQRPTHPYGMYPQTTTIDSDPLATSADIATVGFPGLGRQYARRLGPDGEDADDIIGPDGHTEQLPPYTRYPDGSPQPKERYAPGPPPAGIPSAIPPPAGPPPAGLPSAAATTATSSSIHTSMEDTAVQETSSPREQLLADDDDAEAHAEAVTSDGARPKWARRSKKRLFGGRVPAWFLCIGVFILIALAATVGGVIGHSMAFMHNHGGQFHNDQGPFGNLTRAADSFPTSYPTSIISITTTLIDAAPVATHGALPTLPSGDFHFELTAPIAATSSCVTNARQVGAGVWGCSQDGAMLFAVRPSDIHSTEVYLHGSPDLGPIYGPQPPSMPGPLRIALMNDIEQPGLGPAFFFQSAYTKQVILQEQMLNNSFSRRSVVDSIAQSLHTRDDHMSPGDNPWVCNWNNTLLEGFIYIAAPPPGSSNATHSSITSSSTPTAAPGPTGSSPPPPNSPRAPGLAPLAGAQPATGPPAPTQPARLRARNGLRERDGGDSDGDHGGHGGGGRGAFWKYLHGETDNPANPYPFPMKFEERRTPANPIKPYCQQMTVNKDMTLTPKLNNGQPILITIDETDPLSQEEHSETTGLPILQPPSNPPRRRKRTTDPNACVCKWMT